MVYPFTNLRRFGCHIQLSPPLQSSDAMGSIHISPSQVPAPTARNARTNAESGHKSLLDKRAAQLLLCDSQFHCHLSRMSPPQVNRVAYATAVWTGRVKAVGPIVLGTTADTHAIQRIVVGHQKRTTTGPAHDASRITSGLAFNIHASLAMSVDAGCNQV